MPKHLPPRGLGRAKLGPLLAGSIVLLPLLTTPSPGQAAEPEPWLGRDKAEHYSVSLMLAANGYAVTAASSERPVIRAVCGAGFAFSAGVAKEIYDESSGKRFSGRDLTWDALGTATGTLVAFLFDRYLSKSPRRHP
jgi:putative lipoprotein